MKDWIETTEIQIPVPTVVSIGKFDGDHKGHQKIFSCMRKIAAREHCATAIFTFGTPPAQIVTGSSRPQITTNAERRKKLESAGIEYLVEYPFTAEVAAMSGEDFLKNILIGRMNMKFIVAGPDCAFGRNRSGNAELLQRLGPELGFQAFIIEKEQDEGRDISSSYIREELQNGNIGKANELLGSVYSVEGIVERGNHIGGSILGFPTVNLSVPEGKLLPRHGVYETETRLPDGSCFRGITNVGTNPSVKEDRQHHRARIETFLLNYSGELYDQRICVRFLRFLRPELKFDSLDALKEQIQRDIQSIGS